MSRLRAIAAYYDADLGRIIELEDDVLGIVSQVRELYGDRIAINLDPLSGWFHFTEHCEDGTERLIFSVEELDPRALIRLQEADSTWRGHEDPYDKVEREQDELMAERDAQYREQLFEHGEALIHAMKRDGLAPRMPLVTPVRHRGGDHRTYRDRTVRP